MSSIESIKTDLETIGRRWWWSRFLPQSLAWLSVALVSNAAFLFVAIFNFESLITSPKLWLSFTFGGIVGLWGVANIWMYWAIRSPSVVLRKMKSRWPSIESDLSSALFFGRELRRDSPSSIDSAFARAHIRRSAKMLRRGLENGDFEFDDGDEWRLPASVAIVGALGVGLVGMVFSSVFQERVSELVSNIAPKTSEGEVNKPLLKNLSVHLSPPDYTLKRDRTYENSSGDIRAVQGTDIRIEGRPASTLESPRKIALQFSGDRSSIEGKNNGDSRYRFSFRAESSTRYRFVAPSGSNRTQGPWHELDVEADKPPEVKLKAKSALTLKPNQKVTLELSVSDDFGIRSVSRAHSLVQPSEAKADDWKSKRIWDGSSTKSDGSDPTKEVEKEMTFTPSELGLVSKDSAYLVIRARDNNTVTGPSVGESDAVRIEVVSEEQRHFKLLKNYAKLADEWLTVLADYLETPVGEWRWKRQKLRQVVIGLDSIESKDRIDELNKIQSKLTGLLEATKQNLKKSRKDPLSTKRFVSIFEAFYDQMRDWSQKTDLKLGDLEEASGKSEYRQLAGHLTEGISKLETNILRLQELIANEKMNSVKAMADTLKELNKELDQLIRKYRQTGDESLKNKIQTKINRMKQRMADLMQRMQSQFKNLPREHMNAEALEKRRMKSEMGSLKSQLEKADKSLEDGQFEDALNQLDKMRQGLDKFNKKAGKVASSSRAEKLKNFDRNVSKLRKDVGELKDRQNRVKEETQKLRKSVMRRQRKEAKKEVDKIRKSLAPKLQSLQQKLANQKMEPDRRRKLNDELEALKKGLSKGQLGRSREAIKRLSKKLQRLSSRNQWRRRVLGKRGPKSDKEGQMKQMRKQLENYQRRMEKAAKRVRRKARPDNKKHEKIVDAQRTLEKKAAKLEKELDNMGKDYPMIEKKLKPNLKNAHREASRARSRLDGRKLQKAMDSEQKVLDELNKMQKQLESLRRKRQGGGSRTRKREKVKIPDSSKRRRQNLRQRVLKSLREDGAENLDPETRKYYKSLID